MADLKLSNTLIDSISSNTSTNNVNKLDSSKSKNFIDTMKQTIDEVNKEQKISEKALADVATGQIKDLHQAAIAIGKAETSMKVMLEMRNKAINAYKEISRTQI